MASSVGWFVSRSACRSVCRSEKRGGKATPADEFFPLFSFVVAVVVAVVDAYYDRGSAFSLQCFSEWWGSLTLLGPQSRFGDKLLTF